MAESVRQDVVTDLLTRLATITTANGYETDIGSNVDEHRTTDWQESELEGIDVRDPSEDVEIRGANHAMTIHFEIEAKTTGGTSPEKVRDIIADVTKAIGLSPKFSSSVQDIKPVENESMNFNKKDKLFGSVLMKFDVRYVTKAFTPFSLA